MKNYQLDILWEIPLAFLSFLFYKIMKWAIGNLFTLYLSLNKEKAYQWRVLSQDIIDSTLVLPVLMTKGPRWNTHAIIGTLGPFKVKESMTFDREIVDNSAKSWIMVIYSFPSYKTIANITSSNSSSEKWQSVQLEPGRYTIGLRYYNRAETINLPTIKVDEKQLVKSQTIPADINDFYKNLIERKNWFYLALHYYIYTILRLRKWLPESFVKKEYLPVGAPDTDFFYGNLGRGKSLQVELSESILTNYDTYLTLYDRSSLPVFSSEIQQQTQTTEPIENNGFYLIRVRQKSPRSEKLECQTSEKDTSTEQILIREATEKQDAPLSLK